MNLEAEEIEPIANVTENDLDCVFDESQTAFGKFVILSASDDAFIQSACTWEPTDKSKEFNQRTRSDPYCLEYRDPDSDKQFAAIGEFTLLQIKDAFVEYLRGTEAWKQDREWVEVKL